MKKFYLGLITVVVLFFVFLIIFRESEDTWIKDSRGVWIKHGVPSETPDYVLEQQELINQANNLYNVKLQEFGTFDKFSSDKQFLGNNLDGDYGFFVVWIAPGEEVDTNRYSDLSEFGNFTKFVLLDRNGSVVKIN
jgi:hypothetical protein